MLGAAGVKDLIARNSGAFVALMANVTTNAAGLQNMGVALEGIDVAAIRAIPDAILREVSPEGDALRQHLFANPALDLAQIARMNAGNDLGNSIRAMNHAQVAAVNPTTLGLIIASTDASAAFMPHMTAANLVRITANNMSDAMVNLIPIAILQHQVDRDSITIRKNLFEYQANLTLDQIARMGVGAPAHPTAVSNAHLTTAITAMTAQDIAALSANHTLAARVLVSPIASAALMPKLNAAQLSAMSQGALIGMDVAGITAINDAAIRDIAAANARQSLCLNAHLTSAHITKMYPGASLAASVGLMTGQEIINLITATSTASNDVKADAASITALIADAAKLAVTLPNQAASVVLINLLTADQIKSINANLGVMHADGIDALTSRAGGILTEVLKDKNAAVALIGNVALDEAKLNAMGDAIITMHADAISALTDPAKVAILQGAGAERVAIRKRLFGNSGLTTVHITAMNAGGLAAAVTAMTADDITALVSNAGTALDGVLADPAASAALMGHAALTAVHLDGMGNKLTSMRSDGLQALAAAHANEIRTAIEATRIALISNVNVVDASHITAMNAGGLDNAIKGLSDLEFKALNDNTALRNMISTGTSSTVFNNRLNDPATIKIIDNAALKALLANPNDAHRLLTNNASAEALLLNSNHNAETFAKMLSAKSAGGTEADGLIVSNAITAISDAKLPATMLALSKSQGLEALLYNDLVRATFSSKIDKQSLIELSKTLSTVLASAAPSSASSASKAQIVEIFELAIARSLNVAAAGAAPAAAAPAMTFTATEIDSFPFQDLSADALRKVISAVNPATDLGSLSKDAVDGICKNINFLSAITAESAAAWNKLFAEIRKTAKAVPAAASAVAAAATPASAARKAISDLSPEQRAKLFAIKDLDKKSFKLLIEESGVSYRLETLSQNELKNLFSSKEKIELILGNPDALKSLLNNKETAAVIRDEAVKQVITSIDATDLANLLIAANKDVLSAIRTIKLGTLLPVALSNIIAKGETELKEFLKRDNLQVLFSNQVVADYLIKEISNPLLKKVIKEIGKVSLTDAAKTNFTTILDLAKGKKPKDANPKGKKDKDADSDTTTEPDDEDKDIDDDLDIEEGETLPKSIINVVNAMHVKSEETVFERPLGEKEVAVLRMTTAAPFKDKTLLKSATYGVLDQQIIADQKKAKVKGVDVNSVRGLSFAVVKDDTQDSEELVIGALKQQARNLIKAAQTIVDVVPSRPKHNKILADTVQKISNAARLAGGISNNNTDYCLLTDKKGEPIKSVEKKDIEFKSGVHIQKDGKVCFENGAAYLGYLYKEDSSLRDDLKVIGIKDVRSFVKKASEMSKTFQELNKEGDILSGREGSNVGSRLGFIHGDILKKVTESIEKGKVAVRDAGDASAGEDDARSVDSTSWAGRFGNRGGGIPVGGGRV